MFNIRNLFGSKQPDIKKIYNDGAYVIDVRSADEFRSGHFEGATNIPLDTIASQVECIRKQGKPVILICRSGARSGIATSVLKTAGLEAYNGGGWAGFKTKVS